MHRRLAVTFVVLLASFAARAQHPEPGVARRVVAIQGEFANLSTCSKGRLTGPNNVEVPLESVELTGDSAVLTFNSQLWFLPTHVILTCKEKKPAGNGSADVTRTLPFLPLEPIAPLRQVAVRGELEGLSACSGSLSDADGRAVPLEAVKIESTGKAAILAFRPPRQFQPVSVILTCKGKQSAKVLRVLPYQLVQSETRQQVSLRGGIDKSSACTGFLSDAKGDQVPLDNVVPTDGSATLTFRAPEEFQPLSAILRCDEPDPSNPGQRREVQKQLAYSPIPATTRHQVVAIRGEFTGKETGCRGQLNDASGESLGLDEVKTTPRTAVLTFHAPGTYKPVSVILTCDEPKQTDPNQTEPVTRVHPYLLVPPIQARDGIFTLDGYSSADVQAVCGTTPACAGASLRLQPEESDVTVIARFQTGNRVFVHFEAPSVYSPRSVVLTKDSTTLIARRIPSAIVADKQPNVTFTPLDYVTVKRNFGGRIAKNYLVFNLELHNPTGRKLQMNKSALWFDVDYAEAEKLKQTRLKKDGRRFLYGIDHLQRHSPHTFQQILGSFDAQTAADKVLISIFEIASAVMTGLIGHVGNVDFRTATELYSGILTPGLKNMFLNVEETNRKRANMVAQSLDRIVQIPNGGSASTVVFLPRKGILAYMAASTSEEELIPVLVTQVRDVHMDLEVVSEAQGDLGTSAELQVGDSADKVIRLLGANFERVVEADGTVTWRFSQGAYKEVRFGPAETVISLSTRPFLEQLVAGETTLAKALVLLGPARQFSTTLPLANGGQLFRPGPSVGKDLHFDAKGVYQGEYTEAYHAVKAMEGKTKQELQEKLSELADQSVRQEIEDRLKDVSDNKLVINIPSPDIKGEVLSISFSKDGEEYRLKSVKSLSDPTRE